MLLQENLKSPYSTDEVTKIKFLAIPKSEKWFCSMKINWVVRVWITSDHAAKEMLFAALSKVKSIAFSVMMIGTTSIMPNEVSTIKLQPNYWSIAESLIVADAADARRTGEKLATIKEELLLNQKPLLLALIARVS